MRISDWSSDVCSSDLLIRADPSGLPAALLDRLPEMIDHQHLAREVAAGDRLVHWDARADNVLVRGDEAVLLDWAWASRGAPGLRSEDSRVGKECGGLCGSRWAP